MLLRNDDAATLRFNDVPWPILLAYGDKPDTTGFRAHPISVSLDDLTAEHITNFLLSFFGESPDSSDSETWKKARKDKLRETFLRFHPDKFEGRLMKFVQEKERQQVKEGLVQVVRVLNGLMAPGI
jgi:hypothetical protein